MKRTIPAKRIALAVLALVMLFGLCACGKLLPSISTVTRSDTYRINADGTETLISYDIITTEITSKKGVQKTETFAPDGTLLVTMLNDGDNFTTEETESYAAYAPSLEADCAIMNYAGTDKASDVDYTTAEDDNGVVTDEWFRCISGTVPSIHITYTDITP